MDWQHLRAQNAVCYSGVKLSPRQREIMLMVARGNRDKDVACKLKISERTVAVHITRAMENLGALSRTHAVWLMIPQLRESEKPHPV